MTRCFWIWRIEGSGYVYTYTAQKVDVDRRSLYYF